MQRSTAYRAFRALAETTPEAAPLPAPRHAALPSPRPYRPCACGSCPQCRDNAKWDRIFAKFEVKKPEVRGMYGCALRDL
jgi:hypothetical protein